ncbi:hypothetical protein AB4090_04855 [Acidithiobacillus sp. IBUN Pt1247-S3]|uniref:hypothetical protein n=1 Tax=Acidithiobacillus sp. IBUN Pt1247-S3 TaxID=3166642 RepID=UPI0034E55AF8
MVANGIKIDEIKCRTILVTPEVAGNLLEYNVDNRKIRNTSVKNLSRSMRNGEWIYTHQGIAVDKNGILIDGQHRLKAVLKSGVSVPMLLFENVDPRAFNVIDQGERRSPYDVLRTSPSAAAIVRIAVRMCESDSKPSFARMLPYYEALREDIESLLLNAPSASKYFTTAPIRLCAIVAMDMYPESADVIADIYSKLSRHEVFDLKRVAAGWFTQFSNGTVDTSSASGLGDSIARAMYVFNPNNFNKPGPVVTEKIKNESSDLLRDAIRSSVSEFKAMESEIESAS